MVDAKKEHPAGNLDSPSVWGKENGILDVRVELPDANVDRTSQAKQEFCMTVYWGKVNSNAFRSLCV